MTRETEARRNVCTSFSVTKNPTTIPRTARMPGIIGSTLFPANTPTNNARITPPKNAHAPNKFSRERITMIYTIENPHLFKPFFLQLSRKNMLLLHKADTTSQKSLYSDVIKELQHKMKSILFSVV